jgi:hypothetical protein
VQGNDILKKKEQLQTQISVTEFVKLNKIMEKSEIKPIRHFEQAVVAYDDVMIDSNQITQTMNVNTP